jgi:hypothetical protein
MTFAYMRLKEAPTHPLIAFVQRLKNLLNAIVDAVSS